MINQFVVFFHSLIVSFVSKGYGNTKNFISHLKSSFPNFIFLYRFMIFIKAILLYNKARCFPIQLRAPALNPTETKGSKLSHSPFIHLSGLNLRGYLKYFSEKWLPRELTATNVPFLMAKPFK